VRIIIAGGGTGGHLFPGIAVAEEFQKRDAQNRVILSEPAGALNTGFWKRWDTN
jgi:UDP-N-acetylglucosamine:LPS N-acetylglucosamine transferase